MPPLEISYDPEIGGREVAVLRLRGHATYREAPELRRRLFETVADVPQGRLVLELEAVDKMDTAAMAVLVEGLLATSKDGPELFFCSPSESVRKVFELAGLEDALSRCYGCLVDALDASRSACPSGKCAAG